MSRIDETFKTLRKKGKGALIGYLTLGDPDAATSADLLACLSENADILEMGIPFSDPVADGPTIQAAMERALKNGMNTDKAFSIAADVRSRGVDNPLIFMTYYNIVLQYGVERFIKRCVETDVDGILVTDLPLEEADDFLRNCDEHGIASIFLVAPTTSDKRMKSINDNARGFVYLVSLLGVTGAREKLQGTALDLVKRTSSRINKVPLVVGFGISKKDHVMLIMEAGAEGVVVGSAFVKLVSEHGVKACDEIRKLSAELKEGT